MTGNEYQHLAMYTAAPLLADGLDGQSTTHCLNAMSGLCGEAGEAANIIKKIEFHNHPFTPELKAHLVEEVGDCLWYVAMYCERLGVTMDDVMEQNIIKLQKRYPNKFSSERSINREEGN